MKNGAISKNKWKCTRNCRKIKKKELSVILQICDAFHKPVNRLMDFLYTIDHGCPYNRYPVGVIEYDDGELEFIELKHKGHNIMCHDKNSQCASMLRILRKASTHYATLRVVLRQIYKALQCFDKIIAINSALEGGDYKQLLNVTVIKTINNLLDPSHANTVSSDSDTSGLRDPDLENKITTEHARLIAKYEKEIFSFCDCSCCSCERLLSRKCMTKIEFSDSLVQNNTLLQQLWQHIRANNAAHDTDTFYICNYCKPHIFNDVVPAQCVLNGLKTVPLPKELENLDPLSIQLIQRAKCYQTVIRLGAYTAKVPVYNSLKACKGTMFFLPLPFEKTLQTLEDIENDDTNLPAPELYGVPNVSKLKEIDRLTKFLLFFIYTNPVYINTYMHLYIPIPYI